MVAQRTVKVAPKEDVHPGKIVYMQFCMACHMENGEGVPGLYPPLTQTDFILGEKKRLIDIVIHGMEGPTEVKGEKYNNIMAKLDYILGLYVPIKCKMPDTEIFNNDPFLNPVRHHDFLKSNSKSEKFVEDELKATERTFAYKKQIFTVIQVLSVVIGVVVFLVGIYQIIMHFES